MRSFSCALFTLWGEVMGFRFRKSINLGGGIKVNLSKSGIGYSFGTKGARITKTAKGTTRTTIGIPGSGISYTTETGKVKSKSKKSNTSGKNHSLNNTSDSQNGGNSTMAWIDFIICLLFGYLGVHKFRERKIGMGVLYLFTAGLLCIGWICDSVKYFRIALSTTKTKSDCIVPADIINTEPIVTGSEIPNQKSSSKNIFRTYGAWVLVALFALLALVFFPSFASLIALIAIVFVIPISKWQNILNQYVHGTIKKIAVAGLAVLTLLAAPSTPQDSGVPSSINALPATTASTEPVHVHAYSDATCIDPKTCSSCGETEGSPNGHTWIDANCSAPKTCSVCKETEGNYGEHVWDPATCLAPKTCSICKITEGETIDHTWIAATCTTPKTCSICNKTEGELATHTWESATCKAPKTCSVCNATEGELAKHDWTSATCLAPKTCSFCGTTEGELGDHDWKKATCQNPKTCKVCGEEDGFSTDHKYKSGKCTYCDASEPTVWISKTGKKYHCDKDCSNMKNPSKVTISKAEAKGLKPCSKCY